MPMVTPTGWRLCAVTVGISVGIIVLAALLTSNNHLGAGVTSAWSTTGLSQRRGGADDVWTYEGAILPAGMVGEDLAGQDSEGQLELGVRVRSLGPVLGPATAGVHEPLVTPRDPSAEGLLASMGLRDGSSRNASTEDGHELQPAGARRATSLRASGTSGFPRLRPSEGTRQRMECIASTYPVFDDRRCEEGWDCKAVFSSSCTCCMQELTPPQALHLLNGTHVVFVGDSTARRASRQLRCFLDGSRFVDTSDHRTSHGYVEDRSRGVAVNITSYWVPSVSHLLDAIALHGGEAFFQEVRPGTPRVLVLAIGTHDYILHWAAWKAARDAGQPLKIPLRYLKHLASHMGNAVDAILNASDPTRDMVMLRLPLAQACNGGTKYPNLCAAQGPAQANGVSVDAHDHDYAHLVSEQRRGDLTAREDMGPGAARAYNNAHNNAHNPASLLDAVQRAQAAHRPRMAVQASGPGPGSASAPAPAVYVKPDSVDPINDFVEVAAGVLNSVIRRRHGLDVARLPMIPWTKAPPSLDGAGQPLRNTSQGRHRCAEADAGGTHIHPTMGRVAFLQQVLHAMMLMARDRDQWRDRPWSQPTLPEPHSLRVSFQFSRADQGADSSGGNASTSR